LSTLSGKLKKSADAFSDAFDLAVFSPNANAEGKCTQAQSTTLF